MLAACDIYADAEYNFANGVGYNFLVGRERRRQMARNTRAGAGLPSTAASAQAGLSIIVPLFNEVRNLAALHSRLVAVARRLKADRTLSSEVVYVDDGSSDGTLAAARSLPADGLDVQVIALSRNFGKEAALLAGLDHARLGGVLFIDGDGQHPPDSSRSWSAIGSMTVMTWSIQPRRTANASPGFGVLG